MYHLVNMDHNSMAVQLTQVTVKGFKKCCISNAVYKTDDGMLRHDSKGDGNVKS